MKIGVCSGASRRKARAGLGSLRKSNVVLANGQTWHLAQSQDHALATKNAEGVVDLQRIVQEYPSGTKQSKGSLLDQMVERQRESAIREVLAHLQKETGQNLGNDPNVWIETYAKN